MTRRMYLVVGSASLDAGCEQVWAEYRCKLFGNRYARFLAKLHRDWNPHLRFWVEARGG